MNSRVACRLSWNVPPPPGIGGLRLNGELFTPLEWAAKKGHLAVVEWLCTDERTRPLVTRRETRQSSWRA